MATAEGLRWRTAWTENEQMQTDKRQRETSGDRVVQKEQMNRLVQQYLDECNILENMTVSPSECTGVC